MTNRFPSLQHRALAALWLKNAGTQRRWAARWPVGFMRSSHLREARAALHTATAFRKSSRVTF